LYEVHRLDTEELKTKVIAAVDALRERLIAMSDTVHANPEIGYQEYQTSKLYAAELEEHGFTVTKGVSGLPTAFRAVYPGRGDGPTVAFLAEMDALPGLGHACGHNIIGAASVGAGIAVSTLMSALNGTLLVFATPAEEGAVESVRNTGREALKLEFHGKAAHAGSAPHRGVNALDAAVQTFNMVNALRQHLTSDVRIHGIITQGGDSPNIVPEYAAIKMYVRTPDSASLEAVVEKVTNCARGAALGTGTRVEISCYANRVLPMVANPTLATLFRHNWERLGVTVADSAERRYGSTDMGNVSQTIPSLHPYIAIAPKETPGHSVAFREAAKTARAHEGVILAAKGLAMTAIDLFTRPDHVAQMTRDFAAFKNGAITDY
jgi:metal-dependent amidase/aminoacylase/carboxypeptidase family protein